MAKKALNPDEVLADVGTRDPMELAKKGVFAAKNGEYDRAYIMLAEAHRLFGELSASEGVSDYGRLDVQKRESDKRRTLPTGAVSYLGLCLAISEGRVDEGAKFCELAITREPFQSEHYLNLARIWQVARKRKQMVSALERGIQKLPRSAPLQVFRDQVGYRKLPVLAFLKREHPLNRALGRMRTKLQGAKQKAAARADARAEAAVHSSMRPVVAKTGEVKPLKGGAAKKPSPAAKAQPPARRG